MSVLVIIVSIDANYVPDRSQRGKAGLSQVFRSFEANSTAIERLREGNLAKSGFPAAGHVKSDRLLASEAN